MLAFLVLAFALVSGGKLRQSNESLDLSPHCSVTVSLACSSRMMDLIGVLESSHRALFIHGSIESKYPSLANRVNSVGGYFLTSSAKISPKIPNFQNESEEEL